MRCLALKLIFYLVHRIVVTHLSQVVDKQDSNPVLVCQLLEDTQVTVVAGVWIGIVDAAPDALERVDDDERCVMVRGKEPLDLLLQPAVQLFRHGSEEQIRRRIVGDIQQTVLDAAVAVLQAEVE